jgi:hypothetical protein
MEKPYGIWSTGKGFLVGLGGLIVGVIVGGCLAIHWNESHPRVAFVIFAIVTVSCMLPSFFVGRK